MSGLRSTSSPAALYAVPLVLGLLGAAAAPAGAAASHAPHSAGPSPAAERASTPTPSSVTGPRS